MKETGIVRRVDDLGRIVIPKEIRRSLHIREGDPLELFMEDGNLILKKYQVLKPEFLSRVYTALLEAAKGTVAIYDSSYLMKTRRCCVVPDVVPDHWEFQRSRFTVMADMNNNSDVTTLQVYPINVAGENIGYVAVENCNENYVAGVLAMIKTEGEM